MILAMLKARMPKVTEMQTPMVEVVVVEEDEVELRVKRTLRLIALWKCTWQRYLLPHIIGLKKVFIGKPKIENLCYKSLKCPKANTR